MRQSQQLLGAYKQNSFNNTRILRRDKTYFGLGNMDGNETTYRPIELHHQLVQTPKN